MQNHFTFIHIFIMIYLNIFFNVDFLKQTSINTVLHTVMLVSNQYHCSELTVHKKFDSLNCKIMFYTNFILMFWFLNININLPCHHCWLHKSLYHTVLSLQSTEMHWNHLLHHLFPLQLLYSHKSALINMHYDKDSSEQTILWLNQQCNHLHHNKDSSEQIILQLNQQCNHLHHNKDSKQTILQLNQQCNHITELWIRLNTFRPNWYISLQSCT